MNLLRSKLGFLVLTWISAAHAADSIPYQLGEVQAQTIVKIRETPSLSADVKGTVPPGYHMAVIRKNDWYLILDGEFAGYYMRHEFVKMTDEKFPLLKTTTDSARVRSGPSTKSAVKATLPAGTIFAAQKTDQWLQIKDGRYRGFYVDSTITRPMDTKPEVEKADLPSGGNLKVTSTDTAQTASTPATDISVNAPIVAPTATGALTNAPTGAPTATKTEDKSTGKKPVDPLAPPEWTEKRDQLFQAQVDQIFKKKGSKSENAVQMPVYFETRDAQMGQLETRLTENEPLQVESASLFKMLKMLIKKEWFERQAIKDIDPERVASQDLGQKLWIPLYRLEGQDIKVEFDEKKLEIYIHVPPDLRTPTTASILKRNDADVDPATLADPPAGFSTYLNVNTAEVFDTRIQEYDDKRVPLRAQLDSGTNIGGVVLEAQGRYLEDRSGGLNANTTGFARNDVRLVKDFRDKAWRVSAGDLAYSTTSFQSFRQMAGVSISSQLSMARSKLTYPTGNYEIFLQRNSKVYVWVNNQLQQVLDLPAGRHSLQDFPFTNGANELRLEIVDDVGREETLNYTYFSSTELLRPGLHQFSYATGAPATDVGNTRTYNSNNLTISGYHRYGWSENLTLGVGLQSDKTQNIFGIESLMSTSAGYIKILPAFSMTEGQEMGTAIQTNYTYSDYQGKVKTQRAYSLGFFLGSPTYLGFGATQANGTYKKMEISGGITQGLDANTSLNFNSAFRFFETATAPEDSFTLSFGASRRWTNGISLNSTLSHTKMQTGREDLSLFLFFLWSFPKERQILTAIHNTSDQSSRVDWSLNPSSGAGTSSYSASIQDKEKTRGYGAQVTHQGNRFQGNLNHEVIFEKEAATATQDATGSTTSDASQKKATHHVTGINAGFSIAYAGGHFAIGRPIADSFVIIAPIKNLSGQRIDVNPSGEESYVAKSDFLGPALVPELSSYSLTDITLSGKKLPAELALPKDHFTVFPTYRSGYTFEVGTNANIFLSAKILNSDGQPLSLAAGRAIYLGSDSEGPVTVFTNKKGDLKSEGFRPGRYRLEIATDTFQPLEFEIPEATEGSYNLGTVQLKKE